MLSDLVARARAATDADGAGPAAVGLERLSGGMSHAVFAPADDPTLVLKVFDASSGERSQCEWDALVALAGSGLAPEPVHLDAGSPAVVVMTRVPGASLLAEELGAAHAEMLGRVHRRVHAVAPSARRPLSYRWVREACDALRESPRAPQGDGAADVVARAWRAARSYVGEADVERILAPDGRCFSRGDPNLTNYLWTERGPILIDWEDSGSCDPALELADFAEHASTRALSDDFWSALADATGLTREDIGRVPDARRLLACFWLVLIADRQREGRPTTVTLDDQALRTLAVLAR